MNYIEKLFKQHPFIYFIDGCYYAFGSGTCIKLDDSSILLKPRYDAYIASQNEDLKQYDAWCIFHKLMAEASAAQNKEGYKGNGMLLFDKIEFTKDQIEELSNQVKQYVDYRQIQFTRLFIDWI